MMKDDSENRTRWKHKLVTAHSWKRVGASSWAGGKNWVEARKIKHTLEEKYKFVIFVLSKMRLSTEHRKTKNKDEVKSIKEKHQEIWEPKIPLFTLEWKDQLYKNAETGMWHASGYMANSHR